MFSIVSWFRNHSFGSPIGHSESLLSREGFARQLRLERARADRSELPFVLLTFEVTRPDSGEIRERADQLLVTATVEATREIDIKGRYRDGVAVILPYTTIEEAQVVRKKVRDHFQRRMMVQPQRALPLPELTTDVMAYPAPGRQESEQAPKAG